MKFRSSVWCGVRGIPLPGIVGAILLAVMAQGCRTPVGVRSVSERETYAEVTRNALAPGVPSVFTRDALGRVGLLERFDREPEVVLRDLHARACQRFHRDALFVLAELSILHAEETGQKEYYLAGVVYASVYLFDPEFQTAINRYDPRFRVVCDLYNYGLSQFLQQDDGYLKLKSGTFKLPFGEFQMVASRPGFPWGPEEFDTFRSSWGYRVRGLRTRLRDPGIGTPLIAIRSAPPEEEEEEEEGEGKRSDAQDYLSSHLKVAATVFLRVSADSKALCTMGTLSGSLELYAPFNFSEIEVAGQQVPLETDLTAPLAFALETSKIWDFELGGFLSQVFQGQRTGLFMITPYSPGKIPVVFVHGTASSAARWAEMINDLMADHELRERYQFWFFLYTTGNPVAYSASLLRDNLHSIVSALDPDGQDEAIRKMVVIGHSQGGLLTKMMAVDSGDVVLEVLGIKSLADLELSEEHEELLRKALIWKRVPNVRRVVFIATPHRGSFIAGNWLGRIASSLVSLPGNIRDLSKDLTNRSDLPRVLRQGAPTSVRNMDPASPFLNTLADIPVPPEVGCHSIIPVEGTRPLEKLNDGVVEYKSAHIEEAESEYVVRWNHSCQAHPLAIQEVDRILHQHLRECAPVEGDPPSVPSRQTGP